MTRLYSYCIPCDDGAAPNPFEGVCTLVICKPAIRRTAQVGDWIVGTGAIIARLGSGASADLGGKLVYAMRVTEKMTMEEYDAYTERTLPGKRPHWDRSAWWRKLGDSIYDFSDANNPKLREPCVHGAENIETDRSGKYALLSHHFYYFGDKAIELEGRLREIAQNQQGHRKQLNDSYVDYFEAWIESRGYAPCSVIGRPLYDPNIPAGSTAWGATWGARDRVADLTASPHLVDGEEVQALLY